MNLHTSWIPLSCSRQVSPTIFDGIFFYPTVFCDSLKHTLFAVSYIVCKFCLHLYLSKKFSWIGAIGDWTYSFALSYSKFMRIKWLWWPLHILNVDLTQWALFWCKGLVYVLCWPYIYYNQMKRDHNDQILFVLNG